ncbi:hypothetical protein OIU34_16560 [Pararhizobium sp. BT-229]|uniref:hypothetical protein n=1 Tax=Pararhizobium sp. BT-229 TaxID=2986923 RepID=UPI0021F7A642|nr:hypothetical protein [Pararhizobium sp. BT-229]MCV9963516.1 hypothetical protein [Pararhizobium sp. BT-229]
MIEFLGRNEVATPERMANKYVVGVLPLKEYKSLFIGSPSFVVGANSMFIKGNPIRVSLRDDGTYFDATVVARETHKRETGHVRIICDTLEEVTALMNTRHPIQAIIEKHAGYLEPAEIAKKIEAVYDEVKARFNTPKEAVEQKAGVQQKPAEETRQSIREAVMARVTARLERTRVDPPSMPSHLERVAQPAVSFGRRM